MYGDIRFVGTRDITLDDLDRVRDAMRAKGYECSHLRRAEGGIEFTNYTSLNIRWRSIRSYESLILDPHDEFKQDKQTVVWRTAQNFPWYSGCNHFAISTRQCTERFTRDELQEICECLQTVLGLRPDVIANRIGASEIKYDARIDSDIDLPFVDTDTDDDIRAFLGMDPWKEFEIYAAEPRYPDGKCHPRFGFKTPLSFQCWKCKVSREMDEMMESSPWHLLGCYSNGYPKACTNCAEMLLIPPKSVQQQIKRPRVE